MKKNKICEKKITVDIVAAGLKEVTDYILEASEKELRALEKRFEVEKIHFLTVDLTVYPGEMIKIIGKLQASTCRECVVSLDKFDEKMDEEFEVLYSFEPPAESEEIIDPIVNGRIHLGDMIAEQYGLALNPFPKKPGIENPFEETPQEHLRPFSNLKKILKK